MIKKTNVRYIDKKANIKMTERPDGAIETRINGTTLWLSDDKIDGYCRTVIAQQ